MQTVESKPEIFVETNCVIQHNDVAYESGGAYITPSRMVGYMENGKENKVGETGKISDWHGNSIGVYLIVSKWRTPYSFMSSHRYAVVIRLFSNNRKYYGRTFGAGMSVTGKAYANQTKNILI